jgi:hypothetical protein
LIYYFAFNNELTGLLASLAAVKGGVEETTSLKDEELEALRVGTTTGATVADDIAAIDEVGSVEGAAGNTDDKPF